MNLPSAIFFVNADLNDGIKATLTSQLYIDETMSDTEFDGRVQADPTYPDQVHLNGLRILVIRQNFMDYTNRNLADVVFFVKQGMAYIEKNNFGPPALTFAIDRFNMYELLRFNNSKFVVILPHTAGPPPCGRKLGGIVVDQLADASGVHCPNPDNESNNIDFINRK